MLTKSTLGLVIATLIASFLGFALEHELRVRRPKSRFLWRLHSPGSGGEPVENASDESL